MTLIKRLFQLLELPASKIGAGSSSFTARTFFVRVTRVWKGRDTLSSLEDRPSPPLPAIHGSLLTFALGSVGKKSGIIHTPALKMGRNPICPRLLRKCTLQNIYSWRKLSTGTQLAEREREVPIFAPATEGFVRKKNNFKSLPPFSLSHSPAHTPPTPQPPRAPAWAAADGPVPRVAPRAGRPPSPLQTPERGRRGAGVLAASPSRRSSEPGACSPSRTFLLTLPFRQVWQLIIIILILFIELRGGGRQVEDQQKGRWGDGGFESPNNSGAAGRWGGRQRASLRLNRFKKN